MVWYDDDTVTIQCTCRYRYLYNVFVCWCCLPVGGRTQLRVSMVGVDMCRGEGRRGVGGWREDTAATGGRQEVAIVQHIAPSTLPSSNPRPHPHPWNCAWNCPQNAIIAVAITLHWNKQTTQPYSRRVQ